MERTRQSRNADGNDAAREVVEEGSFRNQLSSIEKHFAGQRRRFELEAGAQSAWISRERERLGHEVIVANARQTKWITASDTKNDPVDARKLARADAQLLAPVQHRSAEQQAELSVIRARDAVLRARTLLIDTARGISRLASAPSARRHRRVSAAGLSVAHHAGPPACVPQTTVAINYQYYKERYGRCTRRSPTWIFLATIRNNSPPAPRSGRWRLLNTFPRRNDSR